MKNNKLKEAIVKAGKGIWNAVPMIIGIVLLVGLTDVLIPKSVYSKVFTNGFFDPLVGSAFGSILAGSPITSYIIGGEFLAQGISLVAVTAFIVAWVTVGIVTLPAEIVMLGKKFAIARNSMSFIFAILVAIITVGVLNLI
jgi:uncharacterized membrane protein YraQ (UPF0718 family)